MLYVHLGTTDIEHMLARSAFILAGKAIRELTLVVVRIFCIFIGATVSVGARSRCCWLQSGCGKYGNISVALHDQWRRIDSAAAPHRASAAST